MSDILNRRTLYLIASVFCSVSVAGNAFAAGENASELTRTGPQTTYERFFPLAEAGDPTIQHFLGYMFFYGEGVELNYDQSHYWFHQAAEEGDPRAQRNLGIFHSRAIERIPEKFYDGREANLWFSLAAANPENSDFSPLAVRARKIFVGMSSGPPKRYKFKPGSGNILYLGACAGCHGFDGRATYPAVPSFAYGERLQQTDEELIKSMLEGRGMMPAWSSTLSEAQAGQIMDYIRSELDRGTDERPLETEQSVSPEEEERLLGEQVYLNFCGGCHGFNGIAWYVNSPSFALRERLDKTDDELAHSIKNGIGAMPSWEYMLRPGHIDALVRFIRSLPQSYEHGIMGELRRPDSFLRFKPKGETGPNWTGDDQR